MRPLVKWWKLNWIPTEMSGNLLNWTMGQKWILFDARKREGRVCKRRLALKQKVWNSQFLDMLQDDTPSRVQRMQSFKQSVEEALIIVIDIRTFERRPSNGDALFAPNAAGELGSLISWMEPWLPRPINLHGYLESFMVKILRLSLDSTQAKTMEAAKKVGLYDFEEWSRCWCRNLKTSTNAYENMRLRNLDDW